MDAVLVGLRAQDFHESLKHVRAFGPKEVHYEKTLLIGKAATLAMHLRGLLYIDNYDQLKYAAASLGITGIELNPVLHELEQVDFVSIARTNDQIRRIEIRVPEFRSGYNDLGERWSQLKPTELEQASVLTLNNLFDGPQHKDTLLISLGLDKTQQTILEDVMGSGLLVATQVVEGQPMIYTPLAVDGNPTAYLQWAKRFPTEVSNVLNTLKNNQGLPLEDYKIRGNLALSDAIQTGVLMPVKISGATGDQNFVFAPHGSLKQEEKTVIDKARAILSCVRYGQNFAAGRPIKYPHLILEQLRDHKRFNKGHPDLFSQYSLLTEKLVGFPEDLGGGRWNFQLYDTDENVQALNVAIEMLEIGETPSTRIDPDAQKALLTPNSYQGPATTRPELASTMRGSPETMAEIIRQMSSLIRGAGSNG